jgi:hypothetical protein
MRYRIRLTFAWIVLLLGAGSCTFAVLELLQQIELSARGQSALGKVVDFALPRWRYGGASADFDLQSRQTSPMRVHVERASSLRDWEKGLTLNLVCAREDSQAAACQVDAFADRWLEPTLLLMFGLPALAWSGFVLLLGGLR